MCVLAFVVLIPFSLKYYLDIPYYVKGEYLTAEVTTQSYNTVEATGPEDKAIWVIDNATGNKFKAHFFTEQIILTGDVYRIAYMPNTKMAVIIEVISSG